MAVVILSNNLVLE